MNTSKQPVNGRHLGVLWLAPLIFFAYSAVRWSSAWSPVHETKQYLLCAVFGSVYAAAMLWFIALPIMMVVLAVHHFTKRNKPRVALPISVAAICLFAVLLTEFAVSLAVDS
jgi:hypothetical protein